MTLVIADHGPTGVTDETPSKYYSLLRTIEEAFGIGEHRITPMTPFRN